MKKELEEQQLRANREKAAEARRETDFQRRQEL